ncbi:MAG TPA: SH3 domain-containing protein [Actinomycetota bacterium]|nr:SH3 domain-containing protein [Actinomycetota bacterium]
MTRERIEGWIGAEDGLSVADRREDPEFDFVLVVEGEGARAGRAEVRKRAGGDRVAIVRAWTLPADTTPEKERGHFDKAARDIGRLPPLSGLGVRREEATSPVLEMSTIVYEDGLSRHTFMTALTELLRSGGGANDTLERAGARDAFAPAPTPVEPEPVQPEPGPRDATTPMAAAAAPPPPPAASTFAPTHKVPEGGMSAWATPDPSAPVAAQLAGGVELQVVEQRGAWAQVMGSNGWTGWVDSRLLQPR